MNNDVEDNNYNILYDNSGVVFVIIIIFITIFCSYIIFKLYHKYSNNLDIYEPNILIINNVPSVLNTNYHIIDLDNLQSMNTNSNYFLNKKDTNILEINIDNMNCIICYDNINMGFKICDVISDHYYCLECIKRVENEFNNRCVICKINTGLKVYKKSI